MSTPFVNMAAVQAPVELALRQAFERVAASKHYVLGPELEAFEAEFAAYCETAHCMGVGNGLDALHLILRAMDIGPGDEVIVPAHTFIATWLAVSYAGATPVAVDVDAHSFNIDPQLVEAAITPRTRAIIAVHLYGQPAAMLALRQICDRHGLRLIEDAAQAHGARCAGQRVGSLGDAAAFSFYPAKNLGALGDGGAVTTQDATLAQRLRTLRNYGSTKKYHHEVAGFNTRLDELQAAFLRAKLPFLDEQNAQRRAIAQSYSEGLGGSGLSLPRHAAELEPVWHLFVIRSPERDALSAHLARHDIATLIHYPIPCHQQAAYATQQWPAMPVSEQLAGEILSLPMWPGLNPLDVITAIKAFSH